MARRQTCGRTFQMSRLVELGGNLGFAAACNRGIAAGEAEIVVLLNNDVECSATFLEHLVAPFADERVGLVAGSLVRPGEHELDSVGITADCTLAGFARLQGRPVADAAAAQPVLVGPSGGAAAYRRVAWEAAGGLDEKIFFYSEDLDLALRLRSAGWTTAAAPDAVGVHFGSATAGAAVALAAVPRRLRARLPPTALRGAARRHAAQRGQPARWKRSSLPETPLSRVT